MIEHDLERLIQKQMDTGEVDIGDLSSDFNGMTHDSVIKRMLLIMIRDVAKFRKEQNKDHVSKCDDHSDKKSVTLAVLSQFYGSIAISLDDYCEIFMGHRPFARYHTLQPCTNRELLKMWIYACDSDLRTKLYVNKITPGHIRVASAYSQEDGRPLWTNSYPMDLGVEVLMDRFKQELNG